MRPSGSKRAELERSEATQNQIFGRSDPGLSSETRLCEKRADNSGEHGDDKLDDGLPAFEVLDHNDKIR